MTTSGRIETFSTGWAGYRHPPLPVEVEFHDVHPIDVSEQELLRAANRLAFSFPELGGCRFVVEGPPAGRDVASYRVRVDLAFPPGRLEVGLPPAAEASQQNLISVVREAMERGRRALAVHDGTHPPHGLD